MKRRSKEASAGITIKPCQICDQFGEKFYLCSRNHSTCEDCKIIRQTVPPPPVEIRPSPSKKQVRFSLPSDFEKSSSPDGEMEETADILEIFCKSCRNFVEVIPVILSVTGSRSLIARHSDGSQDEQGTDRVIEAEAEEASTTSSTTVELYNEDGIRKEIDNLQIELASACSELIDFRGDLDDVMYTTEKLVWDVDMLRGGLSFVHFNFDSVLKRREVRIEETVCEIPFVFMVRMRMVSQGGRKVAHLGFFVGLEPDEGPKYSPLKKFIVLRAHNAYGKVIQEHALRTFENGTSAHPCFDLTKRYDGSLYGYPDFLSEDRIRRPDVLKDGRLCLSLQVEPLHKMSVS